MRCLAVLTALALVAGACGGDDDGDEDAQEPAGSASEAASEVDPEGVARLGYDLISEARGGFSFDPEAGNSTVADLGLYQWIYGGLMRVNGQGELVPDLAESVEIVDPNTIEVELREGLVRTDGVAVDADLVKASIDDNLAKTEVAAFADSFYALTSVEVTSPTSLTLSIPDGTAAGWFDKHIAGVETVVIPPDMDFDAPVGAGPFALVSMEKEQRVVLEKNPDYWDADAIELAGIEMIHVAAEGTATPSALNAGQIDWARLHSSANVKAVGGDIEVLTEPDAYALTSLLLCKTEPPLDDVRVRQALSYATDRDALNTAVLEGDGVPAWDIWPEGHPLYNEKWNEHYAYDLDKAKELMAEAGYADGFDLGFLPYPTMGTFGEVLQSQWAEVGVNVDLVATTAFVEDAFLSPNAPVVGIPVIPQESGRTRHWSGSGVSNMCAHADPELDGLVAELATLSASSAEAVDLMHQVSDLVMEQVLSILVLYGAQWNAQSANIGGLDPVPYSVVVPDVWELFVRA